MRSRLFSLVSKMRSGPVLPFYCSLRLLFIAPVFCALVLLACSSKEPESPSGRGFVRLWDDEAFLSDAEGRGSGARVEYGTVRLHQRPSIVMKGGQEVRFPLDRFQASELRTAVGLRRSGPEQGAAQIRWC